MRTLKLFVVKDEHVKLVKNLHFRKDYTSGYSDYFPAVDHKRPFGNSDISGDIAEILEWEDSNNLSDERIKEAMDLYEDLTTVLQICVSTGKFESGAYTSNYGFKWEKMK